MFNEVFLDDVFVPDRDVVGGVGQGWTVARSTLGNERVTIGRGMGGTDLTAAMILDLHERYAPGDDALLCEVGRILAEEAAMALLNLRHVERLISGGSIGAEGNITKLLSAEHAQRVTNLALRVVGAPAVGGAEPQVVEAMLYARALSFGGGTSEISRNQIAERLLRLPRDPLTR